MVKNEPSPNHALQRTAAGRRDDWFTTGLQVRPRKDKRGVDLISDALPFGRLWYGGPDAVKRSIRQIQRGAAQGIESASNPASQLQLNILMAVAEFGREIIRERVNSGLRAARARGARFGRHSTLQKYLPRVRALREAGYNISQIARELMLPYSSAHKLVGTAALAG